MYKSFPSRREFLLGSGAAALARRTMFGQALPLEHESHALQHHNAEHMVHPALHVMQRQGNALALTPFQDALPLPSRLETGSRTLHLHMRENAWQFHGQLPQARVWSYGSSAMAPLLEFRTGRRASIAWHNDLPQKHLFAIDHSLHGCGTDIPDVRAIAHLHGARVPTRDDGYPTDWFQVGQSLRCSYPMQQDAATLWYHDHAMGLNRLNIYAGLVGMAVVRDAEEDALRLPSGAQELPLILYDRMLTEDGQLLYPVSSDPEHPWVSEFTGDALCVNGKIRPFIHVEPRLYRLRVLNAANSRFYTLSMDGGLGFTMIGSDQGLLAAPVAMDRLALAPGERADLLVDFRNHPGQSVHLRTGAQPMLQFRIAAGTAPAATSKLPQRLRSVPRTDPGTATVTRTITLNEYTTDKGESQAMLLNRKRWHEPVTETPRLGTTEIWEFVNLTEDTHPMHLHLVRFQVLDRRNFDTFRYLYKKELAYTAAAQPPAAHEMGWKDVVQCPGGTVTRISVTFDGYRGKYLYHCHILEHEANDMMRPFEVV